MERKKYCDYLRIFAALAVVAVHVSTANYWCTDVNGMEWQVFNFYNSMSRWAIPIFVMISGSLFLNKDIPIKKMYSKYILRMIVAFVFWSFFYVLTMSDSLENGIIYGVKTHKETIVSGHFHMWFVMMIIGLYMCIPIIKKIISDDKIMKYYLLLSFVFAIFIPWMIKLINDFIAYKSEDAQKMVNAFDKDISHMNMYMVLGYSFYFILGYYLDRIEIDKKIRVIIYFLGIVGAAFTVVADLILTLRFQQPSQNYCVNMDVNVLFEAVAVHTMFRYHNFENGLLNKVAIYLSKYGFGAYLIHTFFIDGLTQWFNFHTLSFNAWLSVPTITMIVWCISFCVSAVLNQIPVIKKYCV